MTKRILVTACNPEETRLAVLEDNELVNYDSERYGKKAIKGNIYLAKVVRIEPSLQAVFIEYGAEKNGFLPFAEIHPDYYKIPVDDTTKDVLEEEDEEDTPEIDPFAYPDMDAPPVTAKRKTVKKRHYNVQEVIHTKQVLLVQAMKDIRGNKCAAFTTYLSLPGQYCVLMPNSGGERNGGVSRKVQEDETRQRLKDVLKKMNIPEKMAVIIRTAGQERTKLEIRRDYEYLIRVWDSIRAKTLESNAPLLIHEEADILMRVIRDFYKKDVDEILVDTPTACKQVRIFMKQMSPSGVKKVKMYKNTTISLFNSFDLENQIIAMVSPRVPLPSGGSLVIGQTEALVAIDVNSGKATKERHIDTTALKTNLEAAKEIAKQLRLRDLSGLIVIDFIDMWDNKHVKQVEKCFRSELESDRSRIQIGNISQFGLLEMSRQRLRSSVMEMYSEKCPHCKGRGTLYSNDYFVSSVLGLLEKAANDVASLKVSVPQDISNLLLNKKRKELFDIEQKYQCDITVQASTTLSTEEFIIDDGVHEAAVLSLGKVIDDPDPKSNVSVSNRESKSPWYKQQVMDNENKLLQQNLVSQPHESNTQSMLEGVPGTTTKRKRGRKKKANNIADVSLTETVPAKFLETEVLENTDNSESVTLIDEATIGEPALGHLATKSPVRSRNRHKNKRIHNSLHEPIVHDENIPSSNENNGRPRARRDLREDGDDSEGEPSLPTIAREGGPLDNMAIMEPFQRPKGTWVIRALTRISGKKR
jgi:ribonuclease E